MVRDNDRVIEPSAGAGVFIPYIETMNGVHLYYDIDPSHNSIEKRDFMTIEKTWNNNTHIKEIHLWKTIISCSKIY